MAAVGCQSFDGVGDRCRAGGKSQGCASAFQSCESLFQNILGGVRQSSVDISRIGQAEPVRRMFAVVENIRCGLIDRDGTRIGRRIRLFLSYMKL